MLEHTEAHVQNSAALVETLVLLVLSPTDMHVSLHVASLFTRVPLKTHIRIINPFISEATVKLFEFILQSTFFSYRGEFYEQVEGVVMGLPLSPMIVDFFMEASEQKALDQALLKPLIYCSYISDTLLV